MLYFIFICMSLVLNIIFMLLEFVGYNLIISYLYHVEEPPVS